MNLHSFRRLLRETDVPDRDLADAVGVSSTTIYRWREGQSRPAIRHRTDVLDLIEERAKEEINAVKDVRRDIRTERRLRDGPKSNGRSRLTRGRR